MDCLNEDLVGRQPHGYLRLPQDQGRPQSSLGGLWERPLREDVGVATGVTKEKRDPKPRQFPGGLRPPGTPLDPRDPFLDPGHCNDIVRDPIWTGALHRHCPERASSPPGGPRRVDPLDPLGPRALQRNCPGRPPVPRVAPPAGWTPGTPLDPRRCNEIAPGDLPPPGGRAGGSQTFAPGRSPGVQGGPGGREAPPVFSSWL